MRGKANGKDGSMARTPVQWLIPLGQPIRGWDKRSCKVSTNGSLPCRDLR
jgi:hypothetical protein